VSAFWQNMADCLRAEVAEYARLLALFEEQQALLFKRDAAGVLRLTCEIEEQVDKLLACRQNREAAVDDFAQNQRICGATTLCSLIAHVSAEAKPLLQALVSELNRLVGRLRRISRHNRLFLIRTIENHQDLLRRLRPGSFTRIYAPDGSVSVAAARGVGAFAAEG